MKTFFAIIGALFVFFVVFVVGIFVAVSYFSSPLTSTADNFFTSIKNNNYQEAEKYLSENFKRITTIDEVKKAFPYDRFKYYTDCTFYTKEANADGTGKLEGKVNFYDGSFLKIKVDLIKENGDWKIDHIHLPQTGLSETQESNPINTTNPNNSNQNNTNQNNFSNTEINTTQVNNSSLNEEYLVHTNMVKLVKAILSDDYTDFYNSTSPQFKQTVSIVRMQEAFKVFKQAKINWQDIKNMKPVITSKEKEEHGIISFKGYYPTTPVHLGFNFEFINNNGEYQVFGVFLKFE
ncbi:conserved hypothetical protein [Thermotomaculum hydrothermale]|uniref:DUF4878 domain-containing protein n=1 Tax=Thermotomaculum hydrothermale TaxID=981385 RepID=A0A7R6SYR0_9BACT|nr:DUF4878 domain-containing protein [Thermotomaculum hydrothermale]BBB32085.1 conserved hypothetical protein [Thermotomaculum hydrothermale]